MRTLKVDEVNAFLLDMGVSKLSFNSNKPILFWRATIRPTVEAGYPKSGPELPDCRTH